MISVTNIRYVFTVWSPDLCQGSTVSFLCGATTVLEISVECEKYSWQVHRGKVNRVNCSNNSRGIPPIYFCVRYLLRKLWYRVTILLLKRYKIERMVERMVDPSFQGCFRQYRSRSKCDLNDLSGVKAGDLIWVAGDQSASHPLWSLPPWPTQVCHFWWIGGHGNTTPAPPSLSE